MQRKVGLVTGASSGLGVALVRGLAARGYDIALTARSKAPMEQLAAEIRQTHAVRATVHPIDLGKPGSAATLVKELADMQIVPEVLVNNAAFGLSEPFVHHDPRRLTSMLQLNMVSLAELTLSFGRRMQEEGRGHILLISSGAAYLPTPSMAAYGATKAFILSLGEALNVELAPTVGVTVASPGPMETGFNVASGYKLSPSMQLMLMPTEQVAKISLDALFAGRPSVIPGRWNRVGVLANRLLSRHAAAKLFSRMARGK